MSPIDSSKPWRLSQCTIPTSDLLPAIDSLHPEVPGFLADLADLIREFASIGTRAFEWSLDSAAGITDPEIGTGRVVAMNQFRWGLDILLGIACQVRAGCCDTAKVHLRSLLEARLGLGYLLKDATERAHAFIACEQHRKLEFLERLDPDTTAGKEHRLLLEKQGLSLSLPGPLASLREQIADLRGLIANPQSKAGKRAFEEYARLHRVHPRPHWYSFFGGPTNMRNLAIHLEQGGTYDILYRAWSTAVHSTDLFSRLRTRGSDLVAYHHLCYFGDAQEVAKHALNEGLALLRGIVTAFAPSRQRDLAEWYETVREQYLFLASPHRVLMPLEGLPAQWA